jgi:hypothetical protein
MSVDFKIEITELLTKFIGGGLENTLILDVDIVSCPRSSFVYVD